MGTEIKLNRNRTTFVRSPKNEKHPFNRVPAKLFDLNGYQFAIMAQIISNIDKWNIVKYEIAKRLGFPREKFDQAWKSLIEQGYIKVKRIQGGYDYTIYEDLSFTNTAGSICEDSTSTTGATCAGGVLTTTNNNYYKGNVTFTADNNCYEKQFNELLELYPSEGTKPDGTKYAVKGRLKECKKAYIDYLKKNAMTHEEIMLALKVELDDRERNGRKHFQKSLFRWIEDRKFEQYKGRIIEPLKEGYGQSME